MCFLWDLKYRYKNTGTLLLFSEQKIINLEIQKSWDFLGLGLKIWELLGSQEISRYFRNYGDVDVRIWVRNSCDFNIRIGFFRGIWNSSVLSPLVLNHKVMGVGLSNPQHYSSCFFALVPMSSRDKTTSFMLKMIKVWYIYWLSIFCASRIFRKYLRLTNLAVAADLEFQTEFDTLTYAKLVLINISSLNLW